MITIDIDQSDLNEAMKCITDIKFGIPRAMMRAINRTVKATRTHEVKMVREETDIPVKIVRATFSMTYAKLADLEGEVVSRGYRLPLIYFKPRPKTTKRPGPPVGVSAVPMKSEGRREYPGTFIGNWPKRKNVLERVDRRRFPIKIARGPSVPEVLDDPGVAPVVEKAAQERLVKRLRHEINFILSQAAK